MSEMKSHGDRLLDKNENNFNLLRLIAALFVIIGHSNAFTGSPNDDFMSTISGGLITPISRFGLLIFFVISGFLVTSSLKNSKSVISFFGKRFLRIFPGLFVCLIFVVFIFSPLFTVLDFKYYFLNNDIYKYFFGNLSLYWFKTSLPGLFQFNVHDFIVNGSLWTLRYEWTFYLMLGVLFFFRDKKPKLILSLILMILFYLCIISVDQTPVDVQSLSLDIHQFATFGVLFFLGALAFELKNYIKYRFVLVFFSWITVFFVLGDFQIVFYLKLIVVAYTTLWLALINLPSKVSRFFASTDFSYGFYIYAYPIGQALSSCFGYSISGGYLALLTILCTAPFAILSWYLVENPMLRFKSVFEKSKKMELVRDLEY